MIYMNVKFLLHKMVIERKKEKKKYLPFLLILHTYGYTNNIIGDTLKQKINKYNNNKRHA